MYDFSKIDPRRIIYMNVFLLANRQQMLTDNALEVITSKQWVAMMMLPMFECPPTLKQLAEVCDTSHQNMKQIAKKLQVKGFVTITKDKLDSRAIRIASTDKFVLFKSDFESKAVEFFDNMFCGFSDDEVDTLNIILGKLYTNMKGKPLMDRLT